MKIIATTGGLRRLFLAALAGTILLTTLPAVYAGEEERIPYDPEPFVRSAYLLDPADGDETNLAMLRRKLADTEARVLLDFGDQVFVVSHFPGLEQRTSVFEQAVPLAGFTEEKAEELCKEIEDEDACTGVGYWAVHQADDATEEGSPVADLMAFIDEQRDIADEHDHAGEGQGPGPSLFPSAAVVLPSSEPEDGDFDPLFAAGGLNLDQMVAVLDPSWPDSFFSGPPPLEITGYAPVPEFYGDEKVLETMFRIPEEGCGPPEPLTFRELEDEIVGVGIGYISNLDYYFNYNPLSPRHQDLETWDFMGGDVRAVIAVVEGEDDWNNVSVSQRSYPAVRAWEEWADWNNRTARKPMTVAPAVRRIDMVADVRRPARTIDHAGGCAEWIDLSYNQILLRRLRDMAGAGACGDMDWFGDVDCMLDFWRRDRPAGQGDWAHLHVILDGRGNNSFEGRDIYGRSCSPMAWSLYTNVIISRYNTKLAFHEIGHAAGPTEKTGAADEYGSRRCDQESGYYATANSNAPRANGNCPSGGRTNCMYRKNDSWLADLDDLPACEFTRQMVGLWDSDDDCVVDQNDTHPYVMIERVPDLYFRLDDDGNTVRQTFRGIAWDCGTPSELAAGVRVTTNEVKRLKYTLKPSVLGLSHGDPVGDLDGHEAGVFQEITLSNPGTSYATFALSFEFPDGPDVPVLNRASLEVTAYNDVLNGSDMSEVLCDEVPNQQSNSSTAGDGPAKIDFGAATPILMAEDLVDTLPFVLGNEPGKDVWIAVQDVENALDVLRGMFGHDGFDARIIQEPHDLEDLGFVQGEDFSTYKLR